MLMAFLSQLGLSDVELVLNSVGDAACRPAYRAALLAFLAPRRDTLCADCRRRMDDNPLRCFDCKVEADRATMARAPAITEYLCAPCREHFDRVLALLTAYGLPHRVDPRLVRGLDYYRRTAFEVTLQSLGAQNALLGGGRYDGLIRELGGPDVPGFGFAVGEERLVMTLPDVRAVTPGGADTFVAAVGETGVERALLLARHLRGAGRAVLFEPAPDKSLKSQLRRANDLRARIVLIIGEGEVRARTVTIKTMSDGAQETVGEDRVAARLAEMTGA
jgi:histidyl-tRNA synthetase